MSPHLKALVKHVAELREAGLEACHYAEEFILWRIRPLGQREKLTFECSWFADPNCNPSSGKKNKLHSVSSFPYSCIMTLCLFRTAPTIEEVATGMKLMFDQSLTGRGSRIPEFFSSDNPPPVLNCPLQVFH
jgi:hypothetical protein